MKSKIDIFIWPKRMGVLNDADLHSDGAIALCTLNLLPESKFEMYGPGENSRLRAK
jgi:hypothetical protein